MASKTEIKRLVRELRKEAAAISNLMDFWEDTPIRAMEISERLDNIDKLASELRERL
jgi:hypothetical protein